MIEKGTRRILIIIYCSSENVMLQMITTYEMILRDLIKN